ncbi:hypothetical protein [Sphingobacterium mizutaii]|uniref:hypothetical protein n=1 Tax=Sphingobacterium mizutaii TaxID=1010 RepID=UPI003D978D7B
MTLLTKRLPIYFLIIPFSFLFCILHSCGPKEIEPEPEPKPAPKPEPEPEPEPVEKPKIILYKYTSEKNEDFIEYLKGFVVKNLTEPDIKLHFGNRVTYFRPDSILIKEDSMFVYKSKMPMGSYQIKWSEQILQIHEAKNNTWKNWASINADSILTLKVSYYKKNANNSKSSHLSFGQQYEMPDNRHLLDADPLNNSRLIWLIKNYVFTPEKK